MAQTPSENTLRVSEIFYSIQGESTWAGCPCVLIRLAGCNLRCDWCDTPHALTGGEEQTIAAIVARAKTFGVSLVEITGGEPLWQDNTPALAAALEAEGFTVLIETNGALSIADLPQNTHRIMDLKCPDSGMSSHIHWPNIPLLRPDRDEVKFVITSRRDYEWARNAVNEHRLQEHCRAVLFSPIANRLDPAQLAAWILQDRLPVRMQIQLHKIIWGPDTQGV